MGEIFAVLAIAKQLIQWIVQQAVLLNIEGKISDEQLAQIKADAVVSETEWDEAVAAARARHEAGGGG